MEPYKTTDIWHCAVLCYEGFTLLGAVQTDDYDNRGNRKCEFYLVHPRPEEFGNISDEILRILSEFGEERNGFRKFVRMYRLCVDALKNPIDPKTGATL